MESEDSDGHDKNAIERKNLEKQLEKERILCRLQSILSRRDSFVKQAEKTMDVIRSLMIVACDDVDSLYKKAQEIQSAAAVPIERIEALKAEYLEAQRRLEEGKILVTVKENYAMLCSSMEKSNLPDACAALAKLVVIDENLLNHETYGLTQNERQSLDSMRDNIVQTLNLELRKGLSSRHSDKSLELISLHIKIGLDKEAFDIYLDSMSAQLRHYIGERLSKTGTSDTSLGEIYVKFLEMTAHLIEDRIRLVNTLFGDGCAILLLCRLFQECTLHATSLLQDYIKDRAIREKLAMSKTHLHNKQENISLSSVLSLDETAPVVFSTDSMRNLDSLLRDIAMVSHRSQIFLDFIRFHLLEQSRVFKSLPDSSLKEKIAESVLSLMKGNEKKQLDTDVEMTIVDKSQFNEMVKELMIDYVVLEEFFMTFSVEHAFEIDSYDEKELTSSVVDDSFYVLKKALSRALNSGDCNSFCAMINMCYRCIDEYYMEMLLNLLLLRQSKSTSKIIRSRSAAATLRSPLVYYLIWLNNYDTSCAHIEKLVDYLKTETHDYYTRQRLSDCQLAVKRINHCLDNLLDANIGYKKHLLQATNYFHTQSIVPLWKNILLEGTKHTCPYEQNDPPSDHHQLTFLSKLSADLGQFLLQYKTKMTKNVYVLVCDRLAEYLMKEIDIYVLSHSFNLVGGLQFDEDVREFLRILKTVIDSNQSFQKLLHVGMILSGPTREVAEHDIQHIEEQQGHSDSKYFEQVLERRVDFK